MTLRNVNQKGKRNINLLVITTKKKLLSYPKVSTLIYLLYLSQFILCLGINLGANYYVIMCSNKFPNLSTPELQLPLTRTHSKRPAVKDYL